MHPDHTQPRSLTEAEPLPTEVVDRVAESAIDAYEQLTCPVHPAGEAMWPPVEDPEAVGRAADRAAAQFEQTAGARDWTVPSGRLRQLAATIGLYVEGVAYDYDRERSRAFAVLECMQGEAARPEVFLLLPEVELPAGPAPRARAERARDGGER
ncbi:MAG TPA: hypothetical protein VG276_06565 [Actinomycetes bacterium]|jgi:hypothetical protein|nr:hypothetical protein [Actinomycetes bacterium]